MHAALPAYSPQAEDVPRRASQSSTIYASKPFFADPRNMVYPFVLLFCLFLAWDRQSQQFMSSEVIPGSGHILELVPGMAERQQIPLAVRPEVVTISKVTTITSTSIVSSIRLITQTQTVQAVRPTATQSNSRAVHRGIAPYTDPAVAKPLARINVHRQPTGHDDPAWRTISNWALADGKNLDEQKTCLTFEVCTQTPHRTCSPDLIMSSQERFTGYDIALPADLPAPPTASATTAFLLRIRPEWLHKNTINQGDIPTYRALVTELQSAGIDVYFLVHLRQEWNAEAWRNDVFPEFKNRVFTFVFEDFTSQYLPGTFRDPVYDNHVSLSTFMNSTIGRQYDFAWWMEDDIRTTGSWATLFNFLNATVPIQRPKPYDWELREDSAVSLSDASEPYQPDLFITVLRDGAPTIEEDTVGAGNRCLDFVRPNELAKAFIMFTGYSRRMHEAMMAYYASGHSCFCEYFVPTIAKRNRLNIHVAKLPVYKNDAVHDVV